MMNIEVFTFNPFQENTYVLYDETKEAIIIDAGCYSQKENEELSDFMDKHELTPKRLIHTHCHVDHMLGNDFICTKYGLYPELHKNELSILTSSRQYGAVFDLNVTSSPEPKAFLDEGDEIEFGNTRLDILHVPGHSPGHLAFVHKDQKEVIVGDILFLGSIGRTDLPGGDHDTLIQNIHNKLMVMDEDFRVHPGHGPTTTIGFEKKSNPFLQHN